MSGSRPFASIISAPGADQEVAEAGARADAGMAVMRRVGAWSAKPPSSVSPARNTRSCGTKHVVEQHDGRRTGRTCAENVAAASPGRPAGARPMVTPGASTGTAQHTAKSRVLRDMSAAGHHQQLMHVGRAGDDRLGAADDDAVRPALLDVQDRRRGWPAAPGRLERSPLASVIATPSVRSAVLNVDGDRPESAG